MQPIPSTIRYLSLALLTWQAALSQAEPMTVVRNTELKAERYIDAATVGQLSAGQSVDSLKSEAGWIQVKQGAQRGWVRALTLKGANGPSIAAVSTLESGRSGAQNTMSTTGIRSIPKASRHALIIGIGEYSISGVSPLKGVSKDMQSATTIAQTMSVPMENITYLRDRTATANEIRTAIQDLNNRVRPGDRVFVYYSGHGTRWMSDSNTNQCMEGLLASDGQAVTNTEISDLLSPIAQKTDKLMVFYDACHSGGIVNQPMRTRSIQMAGLTLTPKFSGTVSPEACAKPSNMRTRSLSSELNSRGVLPDNIVSIAASRPDEVSFDNPNSGGMATVAWRDCMLGKAKDLDSSGSLSVEEITSCAQTSLNQSLAQYPDILGQHMTIGGNKAFIPSFLVASAVRVAPETPPDSAPAPAPVAAPTPVASSSNVPSAAPALPAPSVLPIQPADLLKQIHAQRDASRPLTVSANPSVMRILQDPLKLSIQSSRAGYVYVALAGSDQKSLYLLYPNTLAGNNRIEAGQTIELPQAGWRITAAGPKGTDTVLVMVADSPRDLSTLEGDKVGPFVKTLLNPEGKNRLQWLLGNSENADQKACQVGGNTRNLAVSEACSDSFASALVQVQEVEPK